MQPRRRTALFGVALALGSAACGASPGADAPTATDAPIPVAAPAPDDLVTNASDPAPSTAPAMEPSDTDTDTVEPPADTSLAEVPADEPPATDTPAAILVEPVVGGRLFATDVQPAAQFDANPFPDLVVDDIGKDARVNIKNILPSDRPVLLWAWAPH